LAEDDAPNWSPQQGQALQHERFIAEVLAARKTQESAGKPRWLQFFESAGGVALITVVLGSAGAAVLNSLVQQKLKERELAATAYQEQAKQQQQAIVQASELIASCIGTSEDLAELWAGSFDPSRFSGPQRERILAYRNDTRTKYNTVDSQWRAQSLKLGLSIGLLGRPEDNLAAAWKKVQDSVNDYKHCVEDWNYEHEQSQEFVSYDVSRKACQEKKNQITVELDKFAARAETAWRAMSPARAATR
jgi:hypothetical protein